ncbi:hypothetical protein L195_g038063, partial [Trifolium pratense]
RPDYYSGARPYISGRMKHVNCWFSLILEQHLQCCVGWLASLCWFSYDIQQLRSLELKPY